MQRATPDLLSKSGRYQLQLHNFHLGKEKLFFSPAWFYIWVTSFSQKQLLAVILLHNKSNDT